MRLRRPALVLLALAAVAIIGVTAVGPATGQGPLGFWMFCEGDPLSCDERPVPTVTETGPTTTLPGTTVTETTVSTVTVTAPTTTAPPPTTTEPPPPDPDGTVINLVDTRFVCTGPLSAYGDLPIILEQTLMNSSAAATHIQGAIDLRSGCRGDGDPSTIDLVIHQYGNGRDIGPGQDALVMRLGARDMNITGFLNCGFLNPSTAHQDGTDIRGGSDVTFEDFEVGDWDAQFPTCHGAGGVFYPSGFQNGGPLGDRASEYVQRVLCIRCKIVGSKGFYDPAAGSFGTGAGIYESIDSGAIDSCFSANRPFIVRLNTATTPGAIRPIDVGPYANGQNLKIDRDAGGSQPSPAACLA